MGIDMELNEPIGKHTGNKTTHAKRDKIAFCAKTALEFAHLLRDKQADPPRALITSLPVHAPSDIELMEALRSLGIPNLLERISPPAHLLFETGSHHRKTPFRGPRRCAVLPKGRAFLLLSENMFAASPKLSLCEIADGHGSLFDLLLLLWEACGSYRTHLTWTGAMYETDPLTSVRSLERFVTDNPRIHGARKIKRALRYVRDGSASTRETQIALFMGLPLRYGGFNLGLPLMNYRVEASPQARAIGGRSYFRCDLCWPEAKIDVEYQSDESHEGKRMRIKDSRRTNALISMGWNVINITNNEAESVNTLERISDRVRRLLRKRPHRPSRDLDIKRLELHRGLGIVKDGFD